ncbi:MAG: hypothetical protein LBS11_04405 [Oscillospiraceae bacterium]|jgi:2-dehydro-3-deoxyglucarate aldolase/4-hydroxy-2-oxoheptanedioate aldolase|nr:hypothetical protein [Oscillospiraceae bacterium]
MLSEIYVPNVLRLLRTCGLGHVIVDCEHGYFDFQQVANLSAVSKGIGLPMLARVPNADRALLQKLLDLGADGILLSTTESAGQARDLVRFCRYAPEGDRGISTFRAHTDYQSGDTAELLRRANARVILLCQIESLAAADRAVEIASVPGIDGLLTGPNDMTQRAGILGNYLDERIMSAHRKVAEAARAAGKHAGIITGNASLMSACAAMGMNWFCIGSELRFMAAGAKRALTDCRECLV